MTTTTGDDRPVRGYIGQARRRLDALPAGVIAGALFGAFFGGVLGRVLMRIVLLGDESKSGAETDFGTAGQITVGGSFTLLMLSIIGGVIGGTLYVGLRRWLPRGRAPRALFFGLLMAFGPGVIAISEVDMQIFEPAVPIYLSLATLILLYGASVSWLVDRLQPMRPVRAGPRIERVRGGVLALAALGICALAVLATQNVYANGGTCLSGDGMGGCAARPAD